MTHAETYEQYMREFEIRQSERIAFKDALMKTLDAMEALPVGDYRRLERVMKREATDTYVAPTRAEWESWSVERSNAAAVGDAE